MERALAVLCSFYKAFIQTNIAHLHCFFTNEVGFKLSQLTVPSIVSSANFFPKPFASINKRSLIEVKILLLSKHYFSLFCGNSWSTTLVFNWTWKKSYCNPISIHVGVKFKRKWNKVPEIYVKYMYSQVHQESQGLLTSEVWYIVKVFKKINLPTLIYWINEQGSFIYFSKKIMPVRAY